MGGTSSARAMARLLTVCAVLAGVFVMHALPAQTCAGGAGMTSGGVTATVMPGHGSGPAVAVMVPGETAAAVSAGLPATPDFGTACVFISPPRGLDVLLALLLLAAMVAPAFPTGLPWVGRRSRASHRAPPPRGGSALLTSLCVSRT